MDTSKTNQSNNSWQIRTVTVENSVTSNMTISCGVARDLHIAYKIKKSVYKSENESDKMWFWKKKQFFESLFLATKDGSSYQYREPLSSVTKSMGISFANIDPMLWEGWTKFSKILSSSIWIINKNN